MLPKFLNLIKTKISQFRPFLNTEISVYITTKRVALTLIIAFSLFVELRYIYNLRYTVDILENSIIVKDMKIAYLERVCSTCAKN